MFEISVASSSGKMVIMVGTVVFGLLAIVGFRFMTTKPPRIENHQGSASTTPVSNNKSKKSDDEKVQVALPASSMAVTKPESTTLEVISAREVVNPQEQAPSSSAKHGHQVPPEIREMHKTVYTIKYGASKTVILETWDAARAELDEAGKDLSHASVSFDSQLILQHRELDEFEQWVLRLNDYVFLQRILSIQDMAKVVRNAELTRGSMANCKTKGCVLLNAESEIWTLTIKGLGDYPDILGEVFEQVINPALAEPSIIATCNQVACVKMSTLLGDKITKNQTIIVDKVLTTFTSDQEMVKAKQDNLGAFIPCVSWHEMENIDAPAKQKICAKRDDLLQYFMDNVVVKQIPDEKPSSESINKVVGVSYKPVMVQLKKFIKETSLVTIVKSSLLIKTPDEKN